jgi:hypothetical protein
MKNDIEAWKDIEFYEGYYQVSNKGNVKRLEKLINSSFGAKRVIREKIVKPTLTKTAKTGKGYLSIGLSQVKHGGF